MKACHLFEIQPGFQSPRRTSRRGTILVFAMIALLVTTMIGASLLHTAVTSMRQIQREQQQIQVGWLADAGCQRALAKSQADQKYTGETWDVPAEQLQAQSGATVKISIDLAMDEKSPRTITAIAEYPKGSAQAVRITKRITVPRAMPKTSD